MSVTKFLLSENDIPTHYYNILPDLPIPLHPPLHPGTKQPIGPQDLAPLFPMELIKQEMSGERAIPIPEEVREIYKLYRPTPLIRARRLEKALQTPAHIYYKYEGVSPAGSHKLNTALAQAYYNKKEGVKKLVTETGAGQWGSALSMACHFFDLECEVFMVNVSFKQKPFRKTLMELFGATVHASPSRVTKTGTAMLEKDPDMSGSLGVAISEAIEVAAGDAKAHYALGSVLNHVLLHQTIIGEETLKQFELAGEFPDTIIGCVGGGSNFAGFAFPFIREKLSGKHAKLRAIAVEPEACPTLTRGEYRYDFGDTAGMTPLLEMYTLGNTFKPDPIHAGGLRYHGDSPIVSLLAKEKIIEARAYKQAPVFDAAAIFARSEGIIPAPESSHAIKAAIDEALACKESGEIKIIAFNLSGHGHFDMQAYEDYLGGKLKNT